jgi:hypothetical protein
MRFGRSPAVITSLQRASPWICFVAARRLHAWGPIGPPEKKSRTPARSPTVGRKVMQRAAVGQRQISLNGSGEIAV